MSNAQALGSYPETGGAYATVCVGCLRPLAVHLRTPQTINASIAGSITVHDGSRSGGRGRTYHPSPLVDGPRYVPSCASQPFFRSQLSTSKLCTWRACTRSFAKATTPCYFVWTHATKYIGRLLNRFSAESPSCVRRATSTIQKRGGCPNPLASDDETSAQRSLFFLRHSVSCRPPSLINPSNSNFLITLIHQTPSCIHSSAPLASV